jgi:hypothetical protein
MVSSRNLHLIRSLSFRSAGLGGPKSYGRPKMAMRDAKTAATDESNTLISSDRSRARRSMIGKEGRLDPQCDDRQSLRKGRLRRDVIRRFFGHRRSLSSSAEAPAHLPYGSGRLCRRSRSQHAQRGADLRHTRDAELERLPLGPTGTRLLRHASVLGVGGCATAAGCERSASSYRFAHPVLARLEIPGLLEPATSLGSFCGDLASLAGL